MTDIVGTANGTPNSRMTWKKLSLWFLAGFAAFSAASQIWPSGIQAPPNASPAQVAVVFLVAYLTIYSIVVGAFFFLAFLLARIPTRNRQRPLAPFLGGALLAAAPLLAATIYYSHYAYSRSRAVEPTNGSVVAEEAVNTLPAAVVPAAKSPTDAPQKMVVMVTSQSAQGVTEQGLDATFLKNLETWIVERTEANVRKAYAANGLPDRIPRTSSEATYIETGGRKLAVVRVLIDDAVSQVTVAGIVGDEVKRVACVQESPERIPITFGECADKVNSVFGLQLAR